MHALTWDLSAPPPRKLYYTSATIRKIRWPKTHKTPLTRPLHLGFNYVLTVFKNFREEIEAAKTLLFGLSAGAGVNALSGSSFQSIPSASLKMTSAQSSQAPVKPTPLGLTRNELGAKVILIARMMI